MVMLYMYFFDDDVILFKSFDFKVKSVKQAYKTMNLKAFTYIHPILPKLLTNDI